MIPCHEALSAVPGDEITYLNEINGSEVGTVKLAFWQQAPKGGKVWAYELDNGTIVSNERVAKVIKKDVADFFTADLNETAPQFDDMQMIAALVEDSKLPSGMKSAIHSIIYGSVRDLEVAKSLIDQRLGHLLSWDTDETWCLALPKEK